MCVVSAISNHYMHTLPGYAPFIQPLVQADPEIKEILKKVVEMLDKVDQKLGERDCQDDKKAEFFSAIGYIPEVGNEP